MPLPATSITEGSSKATDLVDYYVRDPVKNRCKNNPVALDCLSNDAIDRWQKRINKKPVELPDREIAGQLITKITKDQENYTWLDVIDTPPYAWVDPKQLKEDETPLSTLMALLEAETQAKSE